MNLITKLVNGLEFLSETTGRIISWLTAILVVVVCYDVFTRYILQKSSVGIQELEWHIFAIIFLLGAAYTLKHDRHVRVDVLYLNFSERRKAWVNLLGSLIFLIPFSILVILASKKFVINSFLISETSPDPGGLPARYILKACIPVGFLLVLLQGLALAFKSFVTLRKTDIGSTAHD